MKEKIQSPETRNQPAPEDAPYFGPQGGLGVVAVALSEKQELQKTKGQPPQPPCNDDEHAAEIN